jgi:hypothetical protein
LVQADQVVKRVLHLLEVRPRFRDEAVLVQDEKLGPGLLRGRAVPGVNVIILEIFQRTKWRKMTILTRIN